MSRSFFVFLFFLFFTLSLEANGLGSKRYRDRFAKVPPAPEREEPVEKGEEDGKGGGGSKGGKTGEKKKKDLAIPAWAKGTDISAITVDAESGQLTSLSHNGFSEPGAPVIWDPDSFKLTFPGRGLPEYVREKFAEEAAIVFLDENGLSLWPSDLQIRHLSELGKGPFLPVDDNPADIVGFYPFSAGGKWPLTLGLEGVPGLPLDFSDFTVDLSEPFVLSNIILHESNPREKNILLERAIHNLAVSGSEDVQKLIRVLNQLEDFKVIVLYDDTRVYDVPEEIRDFDFIGYDPSSEVDEIAVGIDARANARPLVLGNTIKGALIAFNYDALHKLELYRPMSLLFAKGDLESTLLHELVHALQYRVIGRYDTYLGNSVSKGKLRRFMEYEAVSFKNRHNQFTNSRKDKFPIQTRYGSQTVSEWARTFPFTYYLNDSWQIIVKEITLVIISPLWEIGKEIGTWHRF